MSTSISATEIGLPDNAKLKLGTGEDLEIFHDGSHSYIDNTGTGNLYIKDAGIVRVRTASFGVDNADGSEALLSATANGAVELYYDNSKKFETVSTGVVISGKLETTSFLSVAADNQDLKVGAGDDIRIFHDGSSSRFYNATGDLVFRSASYYLNSADGSENIIKGLENGAVELYHNGTKKFETGTNYSVVTSVSNGNPAGLKITNSDANSNYSHAELRLISKNGASYGVIFNDHANGNVRIGHNTTGNTLEVFNDGVIRSQGIKFGSDTSSANNFHDYEEGTFTPTNTIGLTLTNNTTAHYTKIGRVVHIQIDCTFSGSADSSQCGIIQGLPFTSKSGCVNEGSLQFISNTSNGKFDYDEDNTRIFIGASESRIDIQNITGGTFQTRAFMVGRRFRIQMHYLTA